MIGKMELNGRYDLEQLLIVANTAHRPGAHRNVRRPSVLPHDHLDSAQEAREFMGRRGLELPERAPSRSDLDALKRIRDVVQRLADDGPGGTVARDLAAVIRDGRFRLRQDAGIEADATGWNAVAMDLLPPLIELARDPARLRRCQNPDCAWLFIDRSRNHSRQWCEMGVCGNRAKASRFRQRGRSQPSVA
jgi:predicted RNA-binding Zn ribbon-like protein